MRWTYSEPSSSLGLLVLGKRQARTFALNSKDSRRLRWTPATRGVRNSLKWVVPHYKRGSTETDIVKNGMNINNTSLDGYVKGNTVSSMPAVLFFPYSHIYQTSGNKFCRRCYYRSNMSYNGRGGWDVCWRSRWCRRFKRPNQKIQGSATV